MSIKLNHFPASKRSDEFIGFTMMCIFYLEFIFFNFKLVLFALILLLYILVNIEFRL